MPGIVRKKDMSVADSIQTTMTIAAIRTITEPVTLRRRITPNRNPCKSEPTTIGRVHIQPDPRVAITEVLPPLIAARGRKT